MGGNGSTRWSVDYQRKWQVDECRRLNIRQFSGTIQRIETDPAANSVTVFHGWSRDDGPWGSVKIHFSRCGDNIDAWIYYTVSNNIQGKEDFGYSIGLRWSRYFHGMRKWWWVCPRCGRMCGFLYLPSFERRFECRECHRLSYYSQHRESLRVWMDKHFPPPEMKGEIFLAQQTQLERHKEENRYDPHPGYLTTEELLARSGLSSESLRALQAARLLVTDTEDGRYRPKLAGWAKKLAGMLAEGRSVEEIKAWTKSRWGTEKTVAQS